MQVEGWLRRAAATRPDAVAVRAPAGALTYAALDAAASAAAHGLRARGVGPGHHVGLALAADLPFVCALHACLRLGAVAVPVDLRLSDSERAARTAACRLVVDAPLDAVDGGDAALPATHDLDAPAVLLHTSGTTAAPRPVTLTYGNLLWSALGSGVALGVDPGERWLCALPPAHVGGLSILVRSAIAATTAVVHPRFDTGAVLAQLEDCTLVSLVPTMLARLLDAGLAHRRRLRWVLLGGAPAPPALLHRAAAAGVPVATTYGLTEACSQVTTRGRPLFCTRVALGQEGEILVSGPTVAPAAAGPDGWLHTGDLGRLGPDGALAVTGRAADIIVSGGENVAPAEVEAVLEAHPAVAEAAVHARPDAEWGEAVVATVVLRPRAAVSGDDLRAHARGRLAGFKVPTAIAFAERLPRTPSGKVLRRELA